MNKKTMMMPSTLKVISMENDYMILKPEPLFACRACLTTGTKLFNLHLHGLAEAFADLSGTPVIMTDGLPQQICSMCWGLLRRGTAFRMKCRQATVILQNFRTNRLFITTSDVSELHARNPILHSQIAETATQIIDCESETEVDLTADDNESDVSDRDDKSAHDDGEKSDDYCESLSGDVETIEECGSNLLGEIKSGTNSEIELDDAIGNIVKFEEPEIEYDVETNVNFAEDNNDSDQLLNDFAYETNVLENDPLNTQFVIKSEERENNAKLEFGDTEFTQRKRRKYSEIENDDVLIEDSCSIIENVGYDKNISSNTMKFLVRRLT